VTAGHDFHDQASSMRCTRRSSHVAEAPSPLG